MSADSLYRAIHYTTTRAAELKPDPYGGITEMKAQKVGKVSGGGR